MNTFRSSIRAAVLATAAAMFLTLATAKPASAWGERTAYRSCGANWIESWPTSTGARANTIKLSGSCSGRLQVGLHRSNGTVIWVQGTSSQANISASGTWAGGLHRGCYGCGTSYT